MPAVSVNDMFHQAKSQTSSANQATAPRIDAIKAFSQARQMFGCNPVAFIRDREVQHRARSR